MKNYIKVAAVILAFASTSVSGQIFDKLKNAASKVERVSNKIERATGGAVSVKKVAKETTNAAFSNITFSKTRDGGPERNFSATDNIYAHIVLAKPLSSVIGNSSDQMVPVSLTYVINNVQHGEFVQAKLRKEDLNKTEIILDILPGSDAKSEYYMGSFKNHIAKVFSDFGDKIAFGGQQFDFAFGPNDEFKGSFKLTVKSNQDLALINQRIEGAKSAMDNAIASKATLPAEFGKAGKFADPALSLANIRKMISYPGMTILKLNVEAIGGPDYNINKDIYDVPTEKVTNKPVWVAYKEDGKCFYTKKMFTRQYTGGGKYGPLELATSTADVVPIACENIK